MGFYKNFPCNRSALVDVHDLYRHFLIFGRFVDRLKGEDRYLGPVCGIEFFPP
jgi:hypothetical protein